MSKAPYIKTVVRITSDSVKINQKEIMITRNEGWLTSIYRHLGIQYPKFFKMDNLCKAGFLAAEFVVRESDMQVEEDGHPDWSVIVFNNCSSLDNDKAYQETIKDVDNYFPSPSVFVYTLANIVTGEIAIRHKLKGESCSYILPKFAADEIYQVGLTSLLPEKQIDNLLIGWVNYLDGVCDTLLFHVSTEEECDNIALWTKENVEKYY